MMAKLIPNAKKVIVFLSKKYKERADKFEGGVGTEYRMIINEINKKPSKYILATFDSLKINKLEDILPNALGNREVIEINTDNDLWKDIIFSKLADMRLYVIKDVAANKETPQGRAISFFSVYESKGKKDIIREVKVLLKENKQCLYQYGPNSLVAINNPLSEAEKIWRSIKGNKIIPNNKKIVELFEENITKFTDDEIECFEKFKIHEMAFEMNQKERMDTDAVPCFPIEFEEMIYKEEKND